MLPEDVTDEMLLASGLCRPSALKPKTSKYQERDRLDSIRQARITYCKRREQQVQHLQGVDKDTHDTLSAWWEATHGGSVMSAAVLGSLDGAWACLIAAQRWEEQARRVAAEKSSAREALKHEKNHSYRRRMRQILATPPWVDFGAIAALIKERNRLTSDTGIAHHIDHVIPLAGRNVCGLHVHHNMRVIPAKDNMSKGARICLDKFNAEMHHQQIR